MMFGKVSAITSFVAMTAGTGTVEAAMPRSFFDQFSDSKRDKKKKATNKKSNIMKIAEQNAKRRKNAKRSSRAGTQDTEYKMKEESDFSNDVVNILERRLYENSNMPAHYHSCMMKGYLKVGKKKRPFAVPTYVEGWGKKNKQLGMLVAAVAYACEVIMRPETSISKPQKVLHDMFNEMKELQLESRYNADGIVFTGMHVFGLRQKRLGDRYKLCLDNAGRAIQHEEFKKKQKLLKEEIEINKSKVAQCEKIYEKDFNTFEKNYLKKDGNYKSRRQANRTTIAQNLEMGLTGGHRPYKQSATRR